MNRKVLAVRHIAFEGLGSMETLLYQRGYEIIYLDVAAEHIPEDLVDAADLMVLLGGPVGVGDVAAYPFLEREKRAARARLENGRPILGICLGAQIIAEAMGAAVTGSPIKEIGFGPLDLAPQAQDSALAPLAGTRVFHWHGQNFSLPNGARRLASTQSCPTQAFDYGPNVLALQFHLELAPERIESWLLGHAHELEQAGIDPRRIREDAKQHGQNLVRACAATMDGWLDGLTGHDHPVASRRDAVATGGDES